MATLFTKKHYEAIAEVLKKQKPPEINTMFAARSLEESNARVRQNQWRRLVCEFESMFEQDNSAFKKSLFLKAVGFEE